MLYATTVPIEPSVDVLLVTVTDVETEAVLTILKARFNRSAQLRVISERTYFDLGEIGGAATYLVRSEMGSGGVGGSLFTVDAGIQALSPTAVLMVGIAFGMDRKLQRIGDILIGSQLSLYDLQRVSTRPDGELVVLARGDRPSASIRLLDYARNAVHGWTGATVHVGMLLSGDKVIDHLSFRDSLLSLEPEAIGGEMEGAGLYAAAHRHKVDWLVVKAICDWADGTKRQNKGQRQHKAAHNAAEFVFYLLQQGGLAHPRASVSLAAQPGFAASTPPPMVSLPPGVSAIQPGELAAPPAAVLARITHPPTTPNLVGRERELAALASKLLVEQRVIITGMPGVGKTTLATALAHQVAPPKQIFWHSCRAGEGAEAILWALAVFLAGRGPVELWHLLQQRATSTQQLPHDVIFDYLLHVLGTERFVLCLDDVHMAEADPLFVRLVERLLQQEGATVKLILATRQVPLFARLSEVEELVGLNQEEARQLVVGRGLNVSEAEFADLYDQTRGNPQLLTLAIDVLKRTAKPTRLIAELVSTDDIERYLMQQVDAVLSENERLVMRAVAALLEYGGSQPVIEAILDDGFDSSELREMLARLHERFLLDTRDLRSALRGLRDRFLLTTVEGPTGREYHQHTIVRAFYYAELSKRERMVLHRCAASYYTHTEREPLRAAIHFEQCGDFAQAVDVLVGDTWILLNGGQARSMLPLLERLSHTRLDPHLQVAVQIALGEVYTLLRERDLAHTSYEIAYTLVTRWPNNLQTQERIAQICRGMGELLEFENPQAARAWLERGLVALEGASIHEEAKLHYRLSSVLISMSDLDAAQTSLETCLRLLPNDETFRADVLMNLGVIHFARSDLVLSRDFFVQSLHAYQDTGNLWRQAVIRQNLGVVMTLTGEWTDAVAEYHKALQLTAQLGSISRQADIVLNLGVLQMRQGYLDLAAQQFGEVVALSEKHGLNEHMLYAQNNKTALAILLYKWDDADKALTIAERLALELNIKSEQPEIYRNWALIKLQRGDVIDALEDAQRARALAQELEDQLGEGTSRRIEAQVLLATGQYEEAMQCFSQSVALLADDPYEMARTQVIWGKASLSTNLDRGRALLEQAKLTFERLGTQHDLAQIVSI